jgi:hypothetical protein
MGGVSESNIIMTSETNPAMMTVVYGKGWCASPDYMTKQEAEAVTALGSGFCMGNTSVTHFEEFAYFTSVTQAPTSFFRTASNLASIELPTSLTLIRDYCLYNTKITSLDTKNVATISNNSVVGNINMKTVHIGSALESIGTNVFNQSSGVETISVDANNTYFSTEGTTYLKQNSTNTVVMTTIACDKIFEGIVKLIGQCFRSHTLASLDLPSTLTDIGTYTFYQAKITNLICRATTPPTCATNALSLLTVTNIYVPDASVSTYQSTTGWSSYSAKIQGISQM